jgi:hypothetical protein
VAELLVEQVQAASKNLPPATCNLLPTLQQRVLPHFLERFGKGRGV